jgi:hypothetical protein
LKYEYMTDAVLRANNWPPSKLEGPTKVLVATKETQGSRSNDFCWATEDEIVVPGFTCDSAHGEPDGPCGCVRAFCGIAGHLGTTTARVVEKDLTRDQVVDLLLSGDKHAGWLRGVTEAEIRENLKGCDATELADRLEGLEIFKASYQRLLCWLTQYPVGTILERRGEVFEMRQASPASQEAAKEVEKVLLRRGRANVYFAKN